MKVFVSLVVLLLFATFIQNVEAADIKGNIVPFMNEIEQQAVLTGNNDANLLKIYQKAKEKDVLSLSVEGGGFRLLFDNSKQKVTQLLAEYEQGLAQMKAIQTRIMGTKSIVATRTETYKKELADLETAGSLTPRREQLKVFIAGLETWLVDIEKEVQAAFEKAYDEDETIETTKQLLAKN